MKKNQQKNRQQKRMRKQKKLVKKGNPRSQSSGHTVFTSPILGWPVTWKDTADRFYPWTSVPMANTSSQQVMVKREIGYIGCLINEKLWINIIVHVQCTHILYVGENEVKYLSQKSKFLKKNLNDEYEKFIL